MLLPLLNRKAQKKNYSYSREKWAGPEGAS